MSELPLPLHTDNHDDTAFISAIRQATPYLQQFRGCTFVLAISGEIFSHALAQHLMHDCVLLHSLGIRLVIVHGARPQIEDALAEREIPSHYHQGLRVTDAKTLKCITNVVNNLHLEISALLSRGSPDTPTANGGLQLVTGNYVVAKPIGIVDGIDYQYTGSVRRIATQAIELALQHQHVVLLSPLGVAPSGEIFNLGMEDVASAVASQLKAEKLIFFGPTPGILDAQQRIIDPITLKEAQALMQTAQELPDIMQRFIRHGISACQQGVDRVHFLGWQEDGALLLELLTRHGAGTMMTQESLVHLRAAQHADLENIMALIAPLIEAGILAVHNKQSIAAQINHFFVIEEDQNIIACAALHTFPDEKMAEIACLAVHTHYQYRGYGERLLSYCQNHLRQQGYLQLFALTTRTTHWFIERGFALKSIQDLPCLRRQRYDVDRASQVLIKTLQDKTSPSTN